MSPPTKCVCRRFPSPLNRTARSRRASPHARRLPEQLACETLPGSTPRGGEQLLNISMETMSRAEAIGAGLTVYFTGKPCKRRQHISERTINGRCLACQAEYRAPLPRSPQRPVPYSTATPDIPEVRIANLHKV